MKTLLPCRSLFCSTAKRRPDDYEVRNDGRTVGHIHRELWQVDPIGWGRCTARMAAWPIAPDEAKAAFRAAWDGHG